MTVDLAALGSALDERLRDADAELAARFPGERPVRQPVHTVYVPADRYDAELVGRWQKEAAAALDEHGGGAEGVAQAFGLPDDLATDLLERVRAKLDREAIEDLRIDFEDGYGARSDDEEDAAVDAAAAALLHAVDTGNATAFNGIRFKSFEAPTRRRGLRTFARFVEAVTREGALPDGFVVTFPKVTSVDQVEAMVVACEQVEQGVGLAPGAIRFEIQVETPQAIGGPDGTALVARMVHASAGRCTSLHYGTYDYSASCGIAAAYQSMEHPAADHAKAVMQVAAAGTGVHLSDGSTNVLPVGPTAQVHDAWRLHHGLTRRALARAYYQGWDMHPGHLPTRYAAVYAFYREGLGQAAARLAAYVAKAGGDVMDEPATAKALSGYLLRGIDCGALDAAEVAGLTGLSRADLDGFASPRRGGLTVTAP